MANKGMTRIQRGQAITFRLPSDTPDHIIKQLQRLKETERRNFSSKIAEFALEGVSKSVAKEREIITIPLPKQLSKEQRKWLMHAHSEALIGSIVYQLLIDPVRATSVLATLNSTSVNINDALYLQEKDAFLSEENAETPVAHNKQKQILTNEVDDQEDDLLHFDLQKARQEIAYSREEEQKKLEEENPEELLSDFLAKMNK